MTAVATSHVPVRPRRIAVVDDSAAVRQSLRLLLGARGYRVETFADSCDLLPVAQPGRFDCYVIDLKLETIDGFALLEALRAKGIDETAIMISGWELPSLEQDARRAGFASLVRKPMMDMSLIRALKDVLQPG